MRHLTQEMRCRIEAMLNDRASFAQIAKTLRVHPSTIKREVYERAVESNKGAAGRVTNRCVFRRNCNHIQLCLTLPDCTRKCSLCSRCNQVCKDFREELCERLHKPPFVCNGCPDRAKCTLRKVFYIARVAHTEYRTMLRSCREGINVTEEELNTIDNLFSPLIQKGQSIHHIIACSLDELPVCDKTIYRYIEAGLLRAKNGDLQRRCCIKPRKNKKALEHKVDRKCRVGREIESYNALFEDPMTAPLRVYMDTVVSSKDSASLLTFYFVDSHFMLAIWLPNRTSASVINAFNHLEQQLGLELFTKLFSVILTDNGTEFSNPTALETSATGQPRCAIYYCDPQNSNQKSELERNHEFIRLFYPKGTSFKNITQAKLDRILSHINSYHRPSIGDATPYERFRLTYGQEALDRLNQTLIPGDQVTLKRDNIED